MPDDRFQPRKKPKQARSRFLVDAIVSAAGRVLPKLGLEQVTTHDVAEAAGVSVGSLYQYFPSKEAIVGVLVERRAEKDAETVRQILAQAKDRPLEEVIREIVRALVDLHRGARPLYRTMLPLVSRVRRHRFVRELVAGVRREVAADLGRRQPELREEDVDLRVFVAGHALESCIHAALEERPELLDEGAFAAELSELLCRYLARP